MDVAWRARNRVYALLCPSQRRQRGAARPCVLDSLAVGWSDNSPSQSSPRAARRRPLTRSAWRAWHRWSLLTISPAHWRTPSCLLSIGEHERSSSTSTSADPRVRGKGSRWPASRTLSASTPAWEHTRRRPSLAHAHCGPWCQAWVSLVISASRHPRFLLSHRDHTREIGRVPFVRPRYCLICISSRALVSS